jgi:two-component system sensor histidine kinase YesM
MYYKTKLFISHSLLVLLLISIFISLFQYYLISGQKEVMKQNLTASGEKTLQQFDEMVRQMEIATDYILSNMDILNAINILSQGDRSSRSDNVMYVFQQQKTDLQINLRIHAVIKHFYRISYLNPIGDFITSDGTKTDTIKYDGNAISLPWIDEARAANGKCVLVPPAPDPWQSAEKTLIFSLVRMIKGNQNMGFLEFQQPVAVLKQIFSLPDVEKINIIAIKKNGEIIYSDTTSSAADEYYLSIMNSDNQAVKELKKAESKDNVFAVRISFKNSLASLILIQSTGVLARQTRFIVNLFLAAAIFLLLLSMLYAYLISRRLVSPIQKLKSLMESTDLDNMHYDINAIPRIDEIEVLNLSYHRLLNRLDTAIQKQNRLYSLQVQASFDSLQSQVNPHFIYNVLNIISNRGIVSGDEQICDICSSLAAMLRYSTGTEKRLSTLKEEIEHLNNYLFLLSIRYEDKLRSSVEIDENLYDQPFLKIVLQQLAENSVSHGYRKNSVMQIDFKGWRENNWMYIRVRDNGLGFSKDALDELNARMAHIRADIDRMENNLQMDIGGLGLANIYARLYLLYKNRFTMSLGNYGGGEVIIGKILE